MSGQLNVYTARAEPLAIDDIVRGVRERGVDAEWNVDPVLAQAGAPWNPGRLATADGKSLELGRQRILPGEKADIVARASSVSPRAAQLAPELTDSYRLLGAVRTPLAWAVADAIAELTPSLMLDPDSGTLYDRDALRRAWTGATEG